MELKLGMELEETVVIIFNLPNKFTKPVRELNLPNQIDHHPRLNSKRSPWEMVQKTANCNSIWTTRIGCETSYPKSQKNELAEWPISDHCQLASSRVNVDGNEELNLESDSCPDPAHSISNQRSPSLTDRMVVVATVSNSNLMPSSRPRGRTNFFAELFW